MANFVVNVNPYNSLYVLALGASATQLGFLASIGMGMTAIFAILTGWIADRMERKAIFMVGAAAGALVPIAYMVASNWIWLILTFIIAGIADGVIQPAWTAMYANGVSNEKRGTVYGLANVFILAPMLFAGLIGGLIVSNSGGLTVDGIRPVYLVQMALLIGTLFFIWKFLESDAKPREGSLSLRDMVGDYREALSTNGVRSWVFMKSLGSVSIGMAGPFWMIYAAVVHKAPVMTMAYMVTVRSITQIMLSPIAGKFCDSIGRKRIIISGRGIMYVGTVIFMFMGGDIWLILAWTLMGINDAMGIAWSAEEVELVPEEHRSKMTAMSTAAFNALAVPASIVGGFLWDGVSPLAPFIVMVAIDGGVRMPIIYRFVPESHENSKGLRQDLNQIEENFVREETTA